MASADDVAQSEVSVSDKVDDDELDDELDEESDEDGPQDDEPPRTMFGWFVEVFKTWGPALLAIVLIRTFVFQPFSIPSTSMVPTLLIGDHVIVSKYTYGLWVPSPFLLGCWLGDDHALCSYDRWEVVDWADPQRGDIIVFRFPEQKGTHYIKRVVALPGDTIEVQNNQIVLNGVAQERTRIGEYAYTDDCVEKRANLWREELGLMNHGKLTDAKPSGLAWMRNPVTVPDGKVFVMGDNRDNSGDSRSHSWTFVDEELIMGKAHFIWISFDSCDGSLTSNLRWERMGMGLYGPIEPNVE